MKRLLSAKSILLAALSLAVINPAAHAKTMYKWVDEKGKVSFSDQVPPDKADLGHKELDKNAQVIKESSKAKTKAELEIEKRLTVLRKQQEQIVAKQKAHDKKLLSGFLNVEAMDAIQKTKRKVFDSQASEMQQSIKKSEEDLAAQHKKAADYEVKNQKIPAELLSGIEETKKKIAETQAAIKDLQLKKAVEEKKFAADKARFEFLKKSNPSSASETKVVAEVEQPGLFTCADAGQCDKAWPIAKEFVKANSVAKLSIDTDNLFMSEDPVADTDLSLSISKMTSEGKTQIFLDIRCTETVAAKALCASAKTSELRNQFTDYLKTKLNTVTTPAPAPAAPVPAAAPAAK